MRFRLPSPIAIYERSPVWTNRLVRKTSPGEWQFRWHPWGEADGDPEASMIILAPHTEAAWLTDCLTLLEHVAPQQQVLLLGDLAGPLELMLRELGVDSVLSADVTEAAVLQTLALWQSEPR
jgi:hypothetical protein